MDSVPDTHCWVGFPIRISMDQSLLAAPHGLTQRATSFIASQCQGIHQMPLKRLIDTQLSLAPTRRDQPTRRPEPFGKQSRYKHLRARCAQTTCSRASLRQKPQVEPPACHLAYLGFHSFHDVQEPVAHRTTNLMSSPQGLLLRGCSMQCLVEAIGIEPTTSCLQSTCSPN